MAGKRDWTLCWYAPPLRPILFPYLPLSGHPVPAPHLVNEKPQVGGKRHGMLSAFPRTIEEETFLRGAWPTDANGVSQFTS